VSPPDRPIWHVLTGEYPPRLGGVGDYSALLAAGLAATGCAVHVWTTPAAGWPGETPQAAGVTVHRDLAGWSPSELRQLGSALDAFPAPRRLIVQHVPNAWGRKGLNFAFCRWVAHRRRLGDEVRVMFHEVAFPWELRGGPKRWVLAGGQRWMGRILAKGADHVDVSIPAWAEMLHRCTPEDRREYGLRPVPSNIPVVDDAAGAAAVRRAAAPAGETVIGSFGSFADRVVVQLVPVLARLLVDRPGRVVLLIGQKGDQVAALLRKAHPELNGRLVVTGSLAAADASRHLQACDVLVQPYPDGVSGRRGSVMAGLEHGVATATNAAWHTEAFWAESGGVALAPTPTPAAITEQAERLLADQELRRRVGDAGRALHEERFAIGRAVEAILATGGSA
jgi:glycosyltransferase involved in cell wall biosynthesis